MRKLILVAHISLDGFVAAPNGDLSWFPGGEESLEFVCKLTRDADAALFGRNSFLLLNAYWPTAKDKPNATKGEIAYSHWYNNATKIVLSATMNDEGLNNVVIIQDNISDNIKKIKEQEGKDILIFGSPATTRHLMQYNLIDEYWIFTNPVLFGEGIALFPKSDYRTALRLVDTKQLANGELAIHYGVKT